MYQETQGKYIQQNLQHLGQFSEPDRFNLQKLSQELNNVEIAHQDIKVKLETARAMCSYLALLPGPITTISTLKGIPQGSDAISKMNMWNAMTLHLNTLAHETKRSRIMHELENTWTMDKLIKHGKQIDVCLCTFRQFIEETNMVPTPESVYYKHYQDFLASLTDHVKKMIFLPEQIITMGVLFAHGRNCSQFEVVRRMLTMLHLALNIRVRNSRTAESKAEAIVQYIQIGEDKDRETLFKEVMDIIAHHYGFLCQCPFHNDLNLPPNWLEFEKEHPTWEEVETLLKMARGAQNLDAQYIPDSEVREELQYRIYTGMIRQLTNTSMMAQPDNRHDQELYCRAYHLTYNREHILTLLIRLLDHFPNADLGFINMRLHKLEVIHMQLCRCSHHKKFRELTQYKSSSAQSWTHALRVHQREEDTPSRMKLGGLKKQFVLPQIWDCERAGTRIARYIPDKIRSASEGSLVVNMISHMDPNQAVIAKLMWCINEYTESLTRQDNNNNKRMGMIWTQSASYRTFVHIFRTRSRAPSYGIPLTPLYPSPIIPPTVPTLVDIPGFVTPPKKPRTEPVVIPAEHRQLEPNPMSPGQALQALNTTLAIPNLQVAFNPMMPYTFPTCGPIAPGVTAKRKAEEKRSEMLLNQTLEQAPVFKRPLPRIVSTGANRVRPPPGIRTQPLPPEQRHFPPGPQKAIRVPTRILRRKESEYERGSLRVQSARQCQTPTSLVKEVGEVQQIQKMLTAEEMLRGNRDQEMGTPSPQGPHSQQQTEQESQVQSKVVEDNTSSTSQESPISENLDLEKMMEETEVKTVHQGEATKEP